MGRAHTAAALPKGSALRRSAFAVVVAAGSFSFTTGLVSLADSRHAWIAGLVTGTAHGATAYHGLRRRQRHVAARLLRLAAHEARVAGLYPDVPPNRGFGGVGDPPSWKGVTRL